MGSLVCRKPIYPAGTVNAQRPDWLVAVTFASVDDPVCVLNSPNWNPFTVLMSVAVAQSRWAACPPNDSAHDPTAADGVVPGVASGPSADGRDLIRPAGRPSAPGEHQHNRQYGYQKGEPRAASLHGMETQRSPARFRGRL